MVARQYPIRFAKYGVTRMDSPNSMLQTEEPLLHRKWPWRILPFASDLGTIGYLMNRPKLGLAGWVIATPYYLYAIMRRPNRKKRNEEVLYQSTANGIFPAIEAKLGVIAGGLLHDQLNPNLLQKYPGSALTRLSNTAYKLVGGILALVALTPSLGDPLSHWLGQQYQTCSAEGVNR